MTHPRDILLGAQAAAGMLPVCDHYSGVEARMRKSLQLQAEMTEEFGACVFDVTLDCEDGAPVGGETEHAALVAEMALGAAEGARVGARVHPVTHPAFDADVATIVGRAARRLDYLMVPKVESVSDVVAAVAAIDAAAGSQAKAQLPLHVLIESPLAVRNAFDIAAHPRVQSLSFGLMDFVSAHAGAIPADGMGVAGQFSHPLVVRAKLEIASAAHAHGKVPSHCVVTEFSNALALRAAAKRAADAFGYTRMWSIHPSQIRPILEAFAPDEGQIDLATRIVDAAIRQNWAPVSIDGALHDRASYRHFWQVLERAHATGRPLPTEAQAWFNAPNH